MGKQITPEGKIRLVSLLLVCEAIGTGVLCMTAINVWGSNIRHAHLAFILISVCGLVMACFTMNMCFKGFHLDSSELRRKLSLTMFIEALAIAAVVLLTLFSMDELHWGSLEAAIKLTLTMIVASPILSCLSLISGYKIVRTYRKAWLWVAPSAVIVILGFIGLVHLTLEMHRHSAR